MRVIISAKYDCQDVSIPDACFLKPLVAGLTTAGQLAPTPSILYNIFIGLRAALHVAYQLESRWCFLWADLTVTWYTEFTGGFCLYDAIKYIMRMTRTIALSQASIMITLYSSEHVMRPVSDAYLDIFTIGPPRIWYHLY